VAPPNAHDWHLGTVLLRAFPFRHLGTSRRSIGIRWPHPRSRVDNPVRRSLALYRAHPANRSTFLASSSRQDFGSVGNRISYTLHVASRAPGRYRGSRSYFLARVHPLYRPPVCPFHGRGWRTFCRPSIRQPRIEHRCPGIRHGYGEYRRNYGRVNFAHSAVDFRQSVGRCPPWAIRRFSLAFLRAYRFSGRRSIFSSQHSY